MAAGQLWLFDPPKPLVERFGDEFFSALPTGPGVYLMCGEAEGVLYVGKARNLRKRLSSYRVANSERLPRRTIRLLHQVRRIEWDECPSEEAARHREELLICVLAPKFNAVGKVWERKGKLRPQSICRGLSKTQLVAKAREFIMNGAEPSVESRVKAFEPSEVDCYLRSSHPPPSAGPSAGATTTAIP